MGDQPPGGVGLLGRTLTGVTCRLLTLNTWKCDGAYRDRLARMAPQALELAPDVVALQESFVAADGSADTARLLGAATGLQADVVRARYKPRVFEGRAVASWSCQAVLHAHPVLRCREIALPSPPDDEDRRAQLVQIDLQGRALSLANVHLTHLGDAHGWRTRQLQAVLDALDQWGPAALTVVCGDFNADLRDESLRGFLQRPDGLRDTFDLAGRPRANTFFDGPGAGRVLDHVLMVPGLTRAGVDVVSADTVLNADRPDANGIAPSDHSGLLVAFRIS